MYVLLVCLVLLITSFTAMSAVDEKTLTKTVTLYRYGSDGTISPITVDLKLKKGEDLAEILADKCNELVENDFEMRNFIQNSCNSSNETDNTTETYKSLNIFSKINSKGKGLHLKTKIRWKLVSKFKIFRILPPYFRKTATIPFIYCKYTNDPTANTTIHSMLFNSTKSFEGNHSIFVYKFVGYASWIGRFSFTPFDFLPRSFSGYAAVAYCKSIP